MRLIDADEQREPVFSTEAAIQFADPLQILQIPFMAAGVPIPEPGEYRLQLFANDRFVRERRVMFVPIPKPPEPPSPPDALGDES
jgi:hypothetical protein